MPTAPQTATTTPATAAGEACRAIIVNHLGDATGRRCGGPAAWRALVACPGCTRTNAVPICDHCIRDATDRARTRTATGCCQQPLRVVAVEPT